MVDLTPEHVRRVIPDEPGRMCITVPLDHPSCRGEEQGETQVGRGPFEHSGRVPHRDVPRRGVVEAYVVDADPIVADHLQPGEPIHHGAVDQRVSVRVQARHLLLASLQGHFPGEQLDPAFEKGRDRRVERPVSDHAGQSRPAGFFNAHGVTASHPGLSPSPRPLAPSNNLPVARLGRPDVPHHHARAAKVREPRDVDQDGRKSGSSWLIPGQIELAAGRPVHEQGGCRRIRISHQSSSLRRQARAAHAAAGWTGNETANRRVARVDRPGGFFCRISTVSAQAYLSTLEAVAAEPA